MLNSSHLDPSHFIFKKKELILTSLHIDASMAPEAFFFCAAWRNTKHTGLYHKHVLDNLNL